MKKQPENYVSLDALRARLVPDFEAGKVYFAELTREFFGTDKGFNNYRSNWAGREALTVVVKGRCTGEVRVNGVRWRLIRARVIWALYHGEWPHTEIGHRNEILLDDRIENLREQTRSDSLVTRRLTNKTGVVGVYPLPNGGFFARVTKNRKIYHVGCFDNLEEARVAREKAALKLQGEFARIDPADHAARAAS